MAKKYCTTQQTPVGLNYAKKSVPQEIPHCHAVLSHTEQHLDLKSVNFWNFAVNSVLFFFISFGYSLVVMTDLFESKEQFSRICFMLKYS